MLPESDISIVILTNSIGLGDPACWIHELLKETLVDDFVVEIRKKEAGTLQVAFQALDSQVWDLQHHEHDTFIWLLSRDNIVK